MITRTLIAVALLTPAAALAQTSDCGLDVDLGGQEFAVDLAVGRVRPGTGRVYFRRDPTCADGTPGCRQSAYLVPGDEVILTKGRTTRSCAVFVNAKGRNTAGWLPNSALSIAVASNASTQPSRYLGLWSRTEASITITAASGGRLKIAGLATYGMSDPARARIGAIHTGELEAVIRPEPYELSFASRGDATLPYRSAGPNDCAVKMQRVGRWLVVDDNNNCGGVNVTLDGYYERKSGR